MGSTLNTLIETLLLVDWNTRVVVLGTAMLGVAAGVIGSILLLRKRALIGDTMSHAMLPGVVGAFLLMQAFGGTGKSFAGLLVGAAIAGGLAAIAVPLLRRMTGLKNDSLMGIILGGGFGLGIVMLSIAQSVPGSNQAGLESFIYGRTASMVHADAMAIGFTSVIALLVSMALAKEFRLLCFDAAFGQSMGRRESWLDFGLMLLAVLVTVVGLQAVGLILVIALFIIPAVAARFWSDEFVHMMVVAGLLGGLCCWMGASFSAVTPGWPAGAVIVLVLAASCGMSMLIGIRQGVLWRWVHAHRLRRRTEAQHLLRAAAETVESTGSDLWTMESLAMRRTWSTSVAHRAIRRAIRRGDVACGIGGWRLTDQGHAAAMRIIRNHRLWELFLIHYADIAASHVDRDADLVEHVLGPDIISELERMLAHANDVPPSPHDIGAAS